MPKTLPRKALISISSFSGAIYPGGLKTGLFYTETLHPFEVLTDAGFEIDLASETGTCGIDEVSLMLQFLSGSDKAPALRNSLPGSNCRRFMELENLWQPADSCRTGPISLTCFGAPLTMSTRFSRARSLPIFQFSSRPS